MAADAPTGVTVAELVAEAGPGATLARPATGGDTVVSDISHDSTTVGAGAMFACLRGGRVDGHDYAGQAVGRGAVALLVDHPLDVDEVGDAAQLVVDDTRLRLGPISSVVHGRPSERLTSVGITGTNGKTTTAQFLSTVFEHAGMPCGVIGTLHGPRTTPEAPELQAALAAFVVEGRASAVLEVSSHALALHRVDGTRFDVVVFTNFGRDHLDLHGTPEEYFRAKARLFTTEFAPRAVINRDDPHGQLLIDTIESRGEGPTVVQYGMGDVADLEVGAGHHGFTWRGVRVRVPIGGSFNVANSLAALTTAVELGVDPEVAAEGLASVPQVPGRFETVGDADSTGFTVVVDYAHTPDGLDEVLRSARAVVDDSAAVVVVFGCGGERDEDKRPEMGAVAARLADRVVVTSDNPRREDPDQIIRHIVDGIPDEYRARVRSDPDRRAAIRAAIELARPGDIVVVAGKGHERTQDLGDEVVEFDDRTVARVLLEEVS